MDLALAKADRADPSNLALIAFRKHIGSADESVNEAIEKREKAYSCILETLELLNIVAQSTQQVSGPMLNASTIMFPSADSIKKLSPINAQQERDAMLERVFESEDELAHVHIFKWLLNHNMSNILIEVKHLRVLILKNNLFIFIEAYSILRTLFIPRN